MRVKFNHLSLKEWRDGAATDRIRTALSAANGSRSDAAGVANRSYHASCAGWRSKAAPEQIQPLISA